MKLDIYLRPVVLLGILISSLGVSAQDSPLEPNRFRSPDETLRIFLDAMNDYRKGIQDREPRLRNRMQDAIRALNLEHLSVNVRKEKGRKAAILLKEVLDRIPHFDPAAAPSVPEGGMALLDDRWRVPGSDIWIIKVTAGERSGEYLFSQMTVERVRDFYQKVRRLPYRAESGQGAFYQEPWVERYLPEWLQVKMVILPNWQWVGLIAALFLGLVIRLVLFIGLRRVSSRMLQIIRGPLALLGAYGFWYLALYLLKVEGNTYRLLARCLQLFGGLTSVWLVHQLVGWIPHYLREHAIKKEALLDESMLIVLTKLIRILVWVMGILVVLQDQGINVVSLMAGLGLGGLAVALAAKDTVANFFGSIMIFLDRPFKVGDWIIVEGTEGVVESIGLRSTRVRTFSHSLMAIPNSHLANVKIDNMGRRQYRKVDFTLAMTYDTPVVALTDFVEAIRKLIALHPKTLKEGYHVAFYSYGSSALEVLVFFYLVVPDRATELAERQAILLEIYHLAERLKVRFAFPSQSVYVEAMPRL